MAHMSFWNLLDAAGSEALKKPFRRPRTWGEISGDFHSIQPLAIPWPFLDAIYIWKSSFSPKEKHDTQNKRNNNHCDNDN